MRGLISCWNEQLQIQERIIEMKTKRFLSMLVGLVLLFTFTACGAGNQKETAQAAESQAVTEDTKEEASDTKEQSSEPAVVQEETEKTEELEATEEPEEPSAETEATASGSEVLVVYFSATGTTKGVAEKIAAIEGADLYEILAAEPYTSDDLNYRDDNSRTSKEQNDKSVRTAIGSETIDLSGYMTIYIGFPIWWGEEPRIMDTFVESYDFTGITLIPFCTSASSGIGESGPNMEALAGTGTWLDGARFSGGVTEEELQAWINGLK